MAEMLDRPRAEWRGSRDGIVWTPWYRLHGLDEQLPHYDFIQVRAWKNGELLVSPIETWE